MTYVGSSSSSARLVGRRETDNLLLLGVELWPVELIVSWAVVPTEHQDNRPWGWQQLQDLGLDGLWSVVVGGQGALGDGINAGGSGRGGVWRGRSIFSYSDGQPGPDTSLSLLLSEAWSLGPPEPIPVDRLTAVALP